MDLPLALAALFLSLLLLAAPPATLFLALHRLRRRRRRREHRPTPAEPAAAELEPRAPAEDAEEKRPRRRARRRQQQKGGDATAAAGGGGEEDDDDALPRFPLASVAGALQRRITARYDDLARASQAQCLTIDQVRKFLDCLVGARNELLQKSENARRKLLITRALLSNSRNCRSSYDPLRLSEQVEKLESEYGRLIKDATVYHNMEEELRLSASYKSLKKAYDVVEKEALERALAAEEPEMTFEELLAEEKKDAAFWWRDGKLRSISD